MKIPNLTNDELIRVLSLARIVSEDSQHITVKAIEKDKSSKDS